MTATKDLLLIIKMRRLELGLSQQDIGDALGVTKVSYGRMEMGKNNMSVVQLQKVCERLGLDFDDLSNRLPMNAKTSPVAVSEYTKVVNAMMDLQRAVQGLEDELKEARAKLAKRPDSEELTPFVKQMIIDDLNLINSLMPYWDIVMELPNLPLPKANEVRSTLGLAPVKAEPVVTKQSKPTSLSEVIQLRAVSGRKP